MNRRELLAWSLGAPWVVPAALGGEPPRRKPPYVLTKPVIVGHMLRIAKVRAGDVVYDLGCGDARILVESALRFGTRCVGVDINPQAVAVARANVKAAGVEHLVTIKQGDLFDEDLSEATVVMLYLFAEMNLRLKPKLFRELPDGARVVSHDFDMGRDWPPDDQYDFGVDAVYLWIMPPKSQRSIASASGRVTPIPSGAG